MQNQFVDIYRNGIKTASDVARMSLETSVRMQEKQLDVVRGILDESNRSADRLAGAGSWEELVELQSRLASKQMERIAEFWSSMWQVAAEQQKSLIGQARDGAREAQSYAATQVSRAANTVKHEQRKSA
jgi:hypothetical protein